MARRTQLLDSRVVLGDGGYGDPICSDGRNPFELVREKAVTYLDVRRIPPLPHPDAI